MSFVSVIGVWSIVPLSFLSLIFTSPLIWEGGVGKCLDRMKRLPLRAHQRQQRGRTMASLAEVNGAERARRSRPSSRSSSANIVSAHLLLPVSSPPLPAKRSTPPGINKDFLCFTFASSVKAEMLLRTRTNQSSPLRESPEWISVLVPRTVGSGGGGGQGVSAASQQGASFCCTAIFRRCSHPRSGRLKIKGNLQGDITMDTAPFLIATSRRVA